MELPHTRTPSLFLVLAAIALAACGGGGGGGGGPADVSGTIEFVPEPGPVIEPNDGVDEPQELPGLRPGARFELCDAVDVASDPIDAFRLVAREPLRIEARLVRLAGEGELPELLVYDPVAMRPVSSASNGRVSCAVQGVLDLVVRARTGHAQYALRIGCVLERAPRWGEGDVLQLSAGAELDLTTIGQERRLAFTAREALELDTDALAGTRVIDRQSGLELSTGPDGKVAIPALSAVELVLAPASAARRLPLKASARAHRYASSRALPPLALEAAPSELATYGRPRLSAVAGELLVKDRADGAGESVLAARGLSEVERIPGDARLVRFTLPADASAEEWGRVAVALCASLAGDPRIEYAERNLVRHASGVVPDDTHYALQWHYPLLHLPEAWAISIGDDAVIVAVIDTGQTDHPDLAGRQIQGFDFISSPASAGDGDGRDADPTDVGDSDGVHPSSFHGTHVAGTIGAATNNGMGVAGVTWFGKLMHLRVLGKDGGTDADIANAIRYAARLSNASGTLPAVRANVINLSLGGPGASSTVQSAVSAARAQGLVIFAAAGNENTSTRSYPAAYTGVISVAAVDRDAVRAPYSNFGSTIDLAAPGGDTSEDLDEDGFVDGVLSTLMDDSSLPATPVFAFYQGTSMACPHAAGVASLMLAVDLTLTPTEIETILKSTATDLGAVGRDDLYGAGLIHAQRAVEIAAGIGPPAMPVLALTPQSIAFGTQLTTIQVGVSNAGTGLLDVDTLTISTTDGGNWLAATPVAILAPVSSDTSAISVHVDRSGLADGLYTGSVAVASNGGVQSIDVVMAVDSASLPLDIDLFVLAVDADTLETVAQVTVNPTTGLDFTFVDLPQGNYVLFAGSDDDGDDAICGAGDTYCGVYPTVNEPEVVRVAGTDQAGFDFPVTGNVMPGPVLGKPGQRAPELRVVHP